MYSLIVTMTLRVRYYDYDKAKGRQETAMD